MNIGEFQVSQTQVTMEKIKYIDNGNNFRYFSVKKYRGDKLFFQVETIDPNAFFVSEISACSPLNESKILAGDAWKK